MNIRDGIMFSTIFITRHRLVLTNGLLERKGQWAPSDRKVGITDPVISLLVTRSVYNKTF